MNEKVLHKWLVPRKYQPTSLTIRHDIAIMLRDHPEAFDCVIFPALPSEVGDETVTVERPVVGFVDREERRQTYGDPLQARAYIVPPEDLEFQAVDSALYESIVGTDPAVTIVLSVPGIRTFSIIQWLEYQTPDACIPVERTYYIAETKPIGRTLNADYLHICYPLPAIGEIPSIYGEEEETWDEDEDENAGDDDGSADDGESPAEDEDAEGEDSAEEDENAEQNSADTGLEDGQENGLEVGEI